MDPEVLIDLALAHLADGIDPCGPTFRGLLVSAARQAVADERERAALLCKTYADEIASVRNLSVDAAYALVHVAERIREGTK